MHSNMYSSNILNFISVRLIEYIKLMRIDKPIGIYLLLWPTLWGLWLAGKGMPDQNIVIIFCLGVFLMRSAGCVINDIADRKFDPHVTRTESRPLAAKTITVLEALIILCILLALSLYLALSLNQLSQLLAIPAVLIALSYPFMKRFHSLPQAHLGIAFSFGIPMAYAAILNTVPGEAWLLFFINVTWVLIYDTQYAMSDREDDQKIAVKSSALLLDSLLGKRDYWAILCLQVLMLVGLFLLGKLHHFGVIWHTSICLVGLFCIKHLFWINRQRSGYDSRNCFRAFLDNNYIGLILSIGLLISLLP